MKNIPRKRITKGDDNDQHEHIDNTQINMSDMLHTKTASESQYLRCGDNFAPRGDIKKRKARGIKDEICQSLFITYTHTGGDHGERGECTSDGRSESNTGTMTDIESCRSNDTNDIYGFYGFRYDDDGSSDTIHSILRKKLSQQRFFIYIVHIRSMVNAKNKRVALKGANVGKKATVVRVKSEKVAEKKTEARRKKDEVIQEESQEEEGGKTKRVDGAHTELSKLLIQLRTGKITKEQFDINILSISDSIIQKKKQRVKKASEIDLEKAKVLYFQSDVNIVKHFFEHEYGTYTDMIKRKTSFRQNDKQLFREEQARKELAEREKANLEAGKRAFRKMKDARFKALDHLATKLENLKEDENREKIISVLKHFRLEMGLSTETPGTEDADAKGSDPLRNKLNEIEGQSNSDT